MFQKHAPGRLRGPNKHRNEGWDGVARADDAPGTTKGEVYRNAFSPRPVRARQKEKDGRREATQRNDTSITTTINCDQSTQRGELTF